MPDLSIEFCGVRAPNPFWLASAPPTNSEYQVRRAFDAGWGGAVWKTLGHEPIVNVSSRYGAIDYDGRKVLGLNNIELITDRTLDDNLREIARVKKAYPKHALFNSIMGVDLDTFAPKPSVRGEGSHGGYCGPAVKPIALHMVSALAGDPEINVPISGIGGIQAWQDGVEFLLLGAGSVQVCTAVMHYGFRIVEQLASGLEGWMLEKGFTRVSDFVGRSVPRIKPWGELDLNYKVVAEIDQNKCIHCGLCYIACEDGAHQSIHCDRVPTSEFIRRNGHQAHVLRSGGLEVLPGAGADTINVYRIKEDTCVGCNLCSLVCPVEGC